MGKGAAYPRILALDALHLLEGLIQRRGALMQALENPVPLLLVQRITRITLLGRVDHHFDKTLADDRRAQHDADELVDLGDDLLVEADELEVATAVPALAHHALGDAVQGDDLDVVEFLGRRFLQVAQAFFEGDEGALEDVGLVDFVGDDDEFFLGRELEHALDVRG